MYYETAQTVGPGWHRSYKPSHYEDMTWSPHTKHFRSPGSSPETYRRIIHPEDDFSSRVREHEDEFFSGRRSPTFPRRIFKEVWSDTPASNQRLGDRPRLFKRVFRPNRWGDDDFESDMPHIRRVEREFNNSFDERPTSRKFDEDFDKRFSACDLQNDIEKEFEKAEGRVHHIPIMVERRMEEMKSRFGRNSPPPERANEEEFPDDWVMPQVQRLRKNFEPEDVGFSSRHGQHRVPRVDVKGRAFSNPIPDTWDPHAVHTLPTRKHHKNSQSFDDSRHPVSPKSVFRSYSETHEDVPRQSQQHSAAFRSHSDGHCPKQTYVTKIEVNLPSQKEKEELRSKLANQSQDEGSGNRDQNPADLPKQENEHQEQRTCPQSTDTQDGTTTKPKGRSRNKYDNPSLQQIAVVLQNVEDLVIRVEAYNGTGRDKQYRFLDEMLTRCMLRLDDVDTEGREDIRNARRAAVKEVQSCIDKLEAKAEERDRHQTRNDSNSQQEASENKRNENEENTEANSKEEDQEKVAKEDTKSVDEEQTKL